MQAQDNTDTVSNSIDNFTGDMHNMKGLDYSESVERTQHMLKEKKIAKHKKHLLLHGC